jgi:Ca2+/Na+ antiporter
MYSAQEDEESTPRAVSKTVILLGSCRLTLMAVIGIWLWSSPARFETSQPAFTSPYPLECTSMSLMGHDIRLSSPTLQAWSLIIYSFFLVPGLNLVLPGVVFLALYIYLHRRRLSRPTEQQHAKALLVIPGLLLLLMINIVFMTDKIWRGLRPRSFKVLK